MLNVLAKILLLVCSLIAAGWAGRMMAPGCPCPDAVGPLLLCIACAAIGGFLQPFKD